MSDQTLREQLARLRERLRETITSYLSMGGLFNPELANHEDVRNLLVECRDALAAHPVGVEPPSIPPSRSEEVRGYRTDGFTLVPTSALRWLFGEDGDFVPSEITREYKEGRRPYWWRSEFRKRIGAVAMNSTAPQESIKKHVGWIAGHCSDPLNCPECKTYGDKPAAARRGAGQGGYSV